MSGPTRRLIGQTRARIEEYLENLEELLPSTNPELTREENMIALDNTKMTLRHNAQKLKEAVETLHRLNKEWGEIMERLSGEKLEEEEKEYNKWTTGDKSFLDTMKEAKETIIVLESRVNEAEILQGHLLNPMPLRVKMQPLVTEQGFTQSGSASKWANLPKLELPTYDGDPLKWAGFWDTFEATVHTQEISPVQKLNYLMRKLTGEAFEALDGITKSNDNYEIAVEILKERFGQVEQIRQALYAQLNDIPKATEKTEDVRRTLAGMDRVTRQLKAMGENLNQESLITQLMEKMPDDVVLEVGKSKPRKAPWQMDRLRAALEDI
uniref:Uncharacterized protein n=1 Tax=Plectus sambesii TaxID=2011161 RepID=A0A914UWK4_9BILA